MEVPSGSIRGPLRYNVETSSPQIEAGKSFSVTIQITNPYDVPVAIYDVQTKLPVDLRDLTDDSDKTGFFSLIKEELKEQLSSKVTPPVTSSGSSPSLPEQSKPPEGGNSQNSTIELQPGNSTVQTFTVKTRKYLLFQPASYNLYFWIDYEIDNKRNKDATCFKLNIRAPLRAIIFGAILGSFMGFLLHNIYEYPDIKITFPSDQHTLLISLVKGISWIIALIGNVILAVIVVIAFARKKDTQPILSIEDFWGGLFIGFLAGYTGKSFLNQFISSSKA